MIEAERHNLELNGDLMELKPISTRKLRRRAADPTGTDVGNLNTEQDWFSGDLKSGLVWILNG